MKSIFFFFSALLALWGGVEQVTPPVQPLQATVITANDYEKMWQQIDSLSQKGLIRDALKLTETLMQQAKTDNNGPQNVKALLYIMRFNQTIEEKADSLNILRIEKELASAAFPVKQIYQSYMADMYWQYYEQHRWEIQSRSKTTNFEPTDFQTWDASRLIEKVYQLRLASIASAKELQQINANDYKALLVQSDPRSILLRPTLYDILAHKAVDFFMNSEANITRPVYKFSLAEEKGLADAAEFIKMDFTSQDSLSRELHIAHIFQSLLTASKENAARVIEVDLKRLNWARNNTTGNHQDTLFLQALEKLTQQYSEDEAVAMVYAQIAELYNQRVNNYKAPEETYRWDRKKAIEICDKMIQRFPNAEGTAKCKESKESIETKSVNVKMLAYNPANSHFLVNLEYRNHFSWHVRVIEANDAFMDKLNRDRKDEKRHALLVAQKPIHSTVVNLPKETDYLTHTTEFELSPLPVGKYIVLISDNAAFDYVNHIITYTQTACSNLTYAKLEGSKEKGSAYRIMNRKTGLPIAKALLTEFEYTRNSKYEKSGRTFLTDANGWVNVPKKGRKSEEYYHNLYYEIAYLGDKIETNATYSYQYEAQASTAQQSVMFFTDRKIYRPGQTIYFKGVCLSTLNDKTEIVPNTSHTIVFRDANYQEITRLALVSNAYGTFQGTVTAPVSGLMGAMTLTDETSSSTTDFSVEEYKRPKFETSFKPVEGSVKLGEKVTAKGTAMGFAGNAIDGAEVRYRVVREVAYPYWYYECWWRPYPRNAGTEIKNGAVKTDAEGNYVIEFDAIPDLTVSKKDKPVFTYTIYADVVDITGETHSTSQAIRLGNIALEASMRLPESVEKSGNDSLTIITQNLNGNFEPAKGTVEIFRLDNPTTWYKSRPWAAPDVKYISKDAFYAHFPHWEYDNEADVRSWKQGAKVTTWAFDTEKSKKYGLQALQSVEQGKYLVTLTTQDKFGTEIKISSYVDVKDSKSKVLPLPAALTLSVDKSTAEPGETVKCTIGTSENTLSAIFQAEREGEILQRQFLTLKKGKITIDIPVTEALRGGFSVAIMAVSHEEMLVETQEVAVPWSNKELKLEWMTFRNKLLPGAKEEWKVKITGAKGEKVAAEMLATMYDASLDAFRSNSYYMDLYRNNYAQLRWEAASMYGQNQESQIANNWNVFHNYYNGVNFDYLNNFGFYFGEDRRYKVMAKMVGAAPTTAMPAPAAPRAEPRKKNGHAEAEELKKESNDLREDAAELGMADSMTISGEEEADKKPQLKDTPQPKDKPEVALRKNLQETAFFFPQLQTNEKGEIIFSFTMPEALTQWKFLSISHTKDLKVGYLNDKVVTQKELMVMPNLPRFLRIGDTVLLSAKIVNLSEVERTVSAELNLKDALTGANCNYAFVNAGAPVGKALPEYLFNSPSVVIPAKQSQVVTWKVVIPESVQAVLCQISASSGEFSDGEENPLPIVSNRMLVTESLPLPIRGNSSRNFTFTNLLKANASPTLRHQQFTLEFTSNPAWYAVQALPYAMEYPHECTEQIFSRLYANTIAAHIANSTPRIQEVFNQWKNGAANGGRDALLSNLANNQSLKTALLEETPWVLNANDEGERKKRVALLFDLNRMAAEKEKAEKQMAERQQFNGSFTWFPGMKENRYITQMIALGVGRLNRITNGNTPALLAMMEKAVPYLDEQMQEDYEYMKRYEKKENWGNDHLSYDVIQYLFMRSYYPEIEIKQKHQEAYNYYFGQAKKYWSTKSMYMKGMLALTMYRSKETAISAAILEGLRQSAVYNDEMGMYWKENASGMYWYEAPIETQALMIEAFYEAGKDTKSVEELKIWLLKNKQTNDWKTTRATVDACNALLLTGSELLKSTDLVEIVVGGKPVNPAERPDAKVEAGTGYFKTAWQAAEITPDFGNISVTKKDAGVAWGAAYWQYFEQMDKIKYAATPLSIRKKLFVEKNSATGPVITPIDNGAKIQKGDKVVVRIEIRVDRDMEYVHLKDMRAAGFEPINVLSQYKYQDGLGYYESTKDLATHFFMDYLPKGTYVFEYPLRATHSGGFSNGITTMQCMYAPEFTTHSEGIRVTIE